MPPLSVRKDLEILLEAHTEAAAKDPFTNPYLLFALDITRRMETGELDLNTVRSIVRDIGADGFIERAHRLGAYLAEPDPQGDQRALIALFEGLAEQGFDAYAAALSRPAVGVVTTAHPTFSLNEESCLLLVQLATGRTEHGEALDEAGIAALTIKAREQIHGPPPDLSLDLEHTWSVRALTHALDALQEARLIALEVARRHWPARWASLSPNLMTLATWVGFDQDGRTDVTWLVSIGKRLELKAAALARLTRLCEAAAPSLTPRLQRAMDIVHRQLGALEVAARDSAQTAAFSKAMVLGREASLADPTALLDELEHALTTEDEGVRCSLIALGAEIRTQECAWVIFMCG